jgi:hypothetical protein
MYWGAGLAILLVAYVASPPLLAVAFRHGPPTPPLNTIIETIYKPLLILYDSVPWYRHYVDVTRGLLMP